MALRETLLKQLAQLDSVHKQAAQLEADSKKAHDDLQQLIQEIAPVPVRRADTDIDARVAQVRAARVQRQQQ